MKDQKKLITFIILFVLTIFFIFLGYKRLYLTSDTPNNLLNAICSGPNYRVHGIRSLIFLTEWPVSYISKYLDNIYWGANIYLFLFYIQYAIPLI